MPTKTMNIKIKIEHWDQDSNEKVNQQLEDASRHVQIFPAGCRYPQEVICHRLRGLELKKSN